jgi:gentisate 1,2-dioxygenase
LPAGDANPRHSPVFRYTYAAAVLALEAAPVGKDGSRRVKYVNPTTGGPAMALMDHQLVQLDPGVTTISFRSTCNAVCTVVEGHGTSTIGNETFAWGPKDVFTMPQGNWIAHRTDGERARLFVYSDREVFARFGSAERRIRQHGLHTLSVMACLLRHASLLRSGPPRRRCSRIK